MRFRFVLPRENSDMGTSPDRSGQTWASADAAAQEGSTSEGADPIGGAGGMPLEEAGDTDQNDQARLMAILGIHHEGRHFHFRGYRFVRLQDAVAYARVVGTRVSHAPAESNVPSRIFNGAVKPPTDADTTLMSSLGVSFEAGRYVCEGFHYERLADAVAYVTLRHSPAT
jgi:hypothetical protein